MQLSLSLVQPLDDEDSSADITIYAFTFMR